MVQYKPAPLLKVHGIADFLKSQQHFPPILEVGPRTVELWMGALDLGVSKNNISRRAPEVLQILRDTAQPPVTREQCQRYQRGVDNTLNRQNLDPPRLSSHPMRGNLRSAKVLLMDAPGNAATEKLSEAAEEKEEVPKGEKVKKTKEEKEEKRRAKKARKARKAKEEEERLAKEEEEREAKKERKKAKKARKAKEEAERLVKEEEDRAAKKEEKKARKEMKKARKAEKARLALEAEEDALFANPVWPESRHLSDDEKSSDAIDVEDLQPSPSPRPQETPSPRPETPLPPAPVKRVQAIKRLADYDAQVASSDSLPATLPTSSTLVTSESVYEELGKSGRRVTRGMVKQSGTKTAEKNEPQKGKKVSSNKKRKADSSSDSEEEAPARKIKKLSLLD